MLLTKSDLEFIELNAPNGLDDLPLIEKAITEIDYNDWNTGKALLPKSVVSNLKRKNWLSAIIQATFNGYALCEGSDASGVVYVELYYSPAF